MFEAAWTTIDGSVVSSSTGTPRRAAAACISMRRAAAPTWRMRDPVVAAWRTSRRRSGCHSVGLIGVGLFDDDLRPVGVEFLGDQHGQHRLDALTDLRVLRHDADRAVGRDRDEGVDVDDRGRRLGGRGRDGGRAVGRVAGRDAAGEQEAAASGGRQQEEAARGVRSVLPSAMDQTSRVSVVSTPAAVLMASRMRT